MLLIFPNVFPKWKLTSFPANMVTDELPSVLLQEIHERVMLKREKQDDSTQIIQYLYFKEYESGVELRPHTQNHSEHVKL